MRRADRLFPIIKILRRTPRPITAAALAAELETSKRTVYRDIADLIGQRVPIRGEAGRLRAGGGTGLAASDADARRDRGCRARRAMGGASQRSGVGAGGGGSDRQDRRRRAGTASALCARAGDRYAAGAEPRRRWSRHGAGARTDPRGTENRAVLSRRTGS